MYDVWIDDGWRVWFLNMACGHGRLGTCRYLALAADLEEISMQKVKIENHTFSGGLWCVGWIFTIGYLQLSFWQGVLAVIIWPYYLGAHFSPLM